MTTALIVGGYGAVGSEICRILAADSGIDLIVAGRNQDKAGALAEEIGAASRVVDANDPDSVAAALDGVDIVVNCFVDAFEPSLTLPEAAIERGIYYMDMAAVPVEHIGRILALDKRAKAGGATLATSLGVNPGIPAVLALDAQKHFDRIESVDVYFTMGSRLEGLSALSLRGVGLMMKTKPLQWREGEWRKPKPSGNKRLVGPPFERKVYFGAAMITCDLVDLPRAIGAERFAFWSGMEKMFQGMVFLLGVKFGRTKTRKRAERFLRTLRWLGHGKNTTNDIGLEMVVVGEKNGEQVQRTTCLHCTEEYATAIAPAILCRQISRGQVTDKGAFFCHQAVAVDDFVDQLRDADLSFDQA